MEESAEWSAKTSGRKGVAEMEHDTLERGSSETCGHVSLSFDEDSQTTDLQHELHDPLSSRLRAEVVGTHTDVDPVYSERKSVSPTLLPSADWRTSSRVGVVSTDEDS